MGFDHTEFEVEVLCPECGSISVILEEYSEGFFQVNKCLNCGYHVNNKYSKKFVKNF